MASSPSSRRTLYTHNSKDYPGCMGGLMHLFDFNQVLAGRKLLTDKKPAAGVEAPRNSLDVGGSIPEVPKSNVEKSEEVPYGYELQKASAPRRLSGMPIKALIAQELSKESDNKNRAPSVVARLMGLDALPTDSKVLQKPSAGSIVGKIDEKFTQRSVVERQRHEEIAPHNVRLYAKKAKASVVSGQKSSGPQRSDSQDGKSGSESLPLRNHPQEQQLQEFKKEFEAWQSQKSWGHSKRSSRLDNVQAHMPSPQGFQREKRFNTKLALPQESAKRNAPQDRLHESREFQDALDFLQSNKEFFMRFLHEPNSLFARHLQDNESGSLSPPQAMEGTKQRRSHRAPDASEGSRPQSWAKDSPISRHCHKSDGRDELRSPPWAKESPISRSPRGDTLVERSVLSMPHSPLINSEESSALHGRYRHSFSPMAPENRSYNANCHIPTRIVVLKPSPGKVRNLKSVSPLYCRSPKDQNANDGFREDSTDVLERLREKLRKDSSGEYKRERRSAGLNINEQYRDASKDPREIAREIARQVRENITRDLMVDPRCVSSVPSIARDTNLGRRPVQATDSRDTSATDVESCGLANSPYWDNYPRSTGVSLHQDKSLDWEALHESREKVSVLEQAKTKSTRVLDEDFGSKNGVFHKDSNGQYVLGQKVLRTSKGSGRYHLDGESHHRSLFHKPTGQVEGPAKIDPVFDPEPLAHHECAEENKAGFSSILLRSQSANLTTPGDENMAELQMYGGGDYLEGLATEVGSARVAHNMDVDLTRPSDENEHAIELATNFSSSTKIMDVSTEGVKQTVVRMEEHLGSHTVEEVPAANMNELLQSNGECSVLDNASLRDTCAEDSTSSNSFSSQKHGTVVHTNDSSVEVLVDLAAQECESSCNAQTMESVYSNHAPLDTDTTTIASPPFVSLPTSDSSADFIAEPVKEQPEQPSPVSVLDLPFQEELVVATEFKELSSDLEELRMHLRLLQSSNGDNDQDNDDSKNNDENFESDLDVSVHLEKAEGGHVEHIQINDSDAPSRSFHNVEEKGKESEMLYVKNILVASGFSEDGSTALTWWYAPGQPLNPCLFQKIENSSFDQEKDIGEHNQAASELSIRGKEMFNVLRRRLLFDRANEVLLNVLGPHFNRRFWSSSLKPTLRVPTGEDLVKLVWSYVWCSLCSHSGSQETLENLVTKDLGKGGDWFDVGAEIEAAGLDVERAILDDLIEEALLVL